MARVIPPAPSRLRRFDHASGNRRVVLTPEHRAIRAGETLFPSTRRRVEETGRVLKSGHNSRKIGKEVTKGKWRGFPIFTLTLEERATCPTSCGHWLSCYGNHMHLAQRIVHDGDFEDILWLELDALNDAHPDGYVVRLHVLGDFYSVAYVDLWSRAIDAFPALHVFGYTARHPDSDIGLEVLGLAVSQWSRFAVRFSGEDAPELGAVTIEKRAASVHVVCPAQRGGTECCATCGFCWQSQRTIAFERH